jgi:hypothetical protein
MAVWRAGYLEETLVVKKAVLMAAKTVEYLVDNWVH